MLRDGKQIGAKIDPVLWQEMRVLALRTGRTATDLLNEAMREYLERHSAPPMGSIDELAPLAEKADKVTRSISKSVKSGGKKR